MTILDTLPPTMEESAPVSTDTRAADAAPDADAVAFEAEARPHFLELHRAARRMTRDDSAAEDLVQDTLERAYRRFGRYERGTNVRAWLLRIMRNVWISQVRRSAGIPRSSVLDEAAELSLAARVPVATPVPSTVEACVIDRLSEATILAAIGTLPARLREAVVLADVDGASYQTIASILGVPLGTVGTRLHRGRRRLRHALREEARGIGLLAEPDTGVAGSASLAH